MARSPVLPADRKTPPDKKLGGGHSIPARPHQAFPTKAVRDIHPNRLIIRIQPHEGITIRFHAKQPGPSIRLRPVDMRFSYDESFHDASPDAYETLLLDVIRGDATLFMRADQVEAAWSVITPVLEEWEASPPIDFPNYQSGTWGPEAAEVLIAQDGRSWLQPTILDDGKKNEE